MFHEEWVQVKRPIHQGNGWTQLWIHVELNVELSMKSLEQNRSFYTNSIMNKLPRVKATSLKWLIVSNLTKSKIRYVHSTKKTSYLIKLNVTMLYAHHKYNIPKELFNLINVIMIEITHPNMTHCVYNCYF